MPGFNSSPVGLKSAVPFFLVSLGLHLVVLVAVNPMNDHEKKKSQISQVEVNVVEKNKPKPQEVIPPPKLEKPKKTKPVTTPPSTMKSATPEKATKPTFGLNPKSFDKTPNKDAIAVPAGNTISIPDDGKRLTPEEVKGLAADLSSDAELVASTFIKPDYTPEAENAELEGSFAIEVYVDAKGQVTEVEIEKKVGFGMDERLKEAAKKARFKPRKDERGQAISGWTKIKIRLTLR